MSTEWEGLSLPELIARQDELGRYIRSKFEKKLALVFTDVVDSTAYFSRFGDTAGRALLQRHLAILEKVIEKHRGRIHDTAGDGAFSFFPSVANACQGMMMLQELVQVDNQEVGEEHRLGVRVGVHFAPVLTDGELVTGDAVHLAARVASTAEGGQIHLSADAVSMMPPYLRFKSHQLGAHNLKGIPHPVEIAKLEWRDPNLFPKMVRVEETKQEITLPEQDTISFGRLAEHEGKKANDVVLALPDEGQTRRIGRWHFKIRRAPGGMRLTAVSSAPTRVDGDIIEPGVEVPVRSGTRVFVSEVLTLTFLSSAAPDQATAFTPM